MSCQTATESSDGNEPLPINHILASTSVDQWRMMLLSGIKTATAGPEC